MASYNITQGKQLAVKDVQQLQVNATYQAGQLSSKNIVVDNLAQNKNYQVIEQDDILGIVKDKQPQHVKVEAGYHYTLSVQKNAILTDDFDLIAKKVGDDLEVLLADGDVVIFDNYFELCAVDLSCLVSLPAENGNYYVTEGAFFALDDGSVIVHFYGEESVLQAIANSQSNVFASSFATDFGVAAKESESGGFSILSSLAAIGLAGAGSGGIVNTVINGFIALGPVIENNGLYVQAYEVDGSKIGNEVKVANDGTFELNLGTYTGVAIFKVIDKTTGVDYHDEAVNAQKDLADDLSAIANIQMGKQDVTITALTELAARKAGVAPDADAVDKANNDVAKAFDVDNIVNAKPNLVIDSKGENTYATSDDYGKVLAAMSGIDKTSGSVDQTIADLAAQFKASGDELTDAGKAMLDMGAAQADVSNDEINNLVNDIAIIDITGKKNDDLTLGFEDTGDSYTDGIVAETTLSNGNKGIQINVANQGTNWVYSIDDGVNWQTGSGDYFELLTGTYNQTHIMVRSGTNTTAGKTGAEIKLDSTATTLVIEAKVTTNNSALDLDPTTIGIQTSGIGIVNITNLATTLTTGIAFDADIVALNIIDIKTIKMAFAGLDTTNDLLSLSASIDVATGGDSGATGTIGGVAGMSYSYVLGTNTLTLVKTDGSTLSAAEVKAITEAVALKNTAISPAQGNRTATISYVDGNNNEGASAAATIMVDTIAPDAVDLDSAANVQDTSATTTNREQLAQGIAFDASIVAPTATDIKQIKVVLGGANLDTTNDKLALNVDITLTLTADTTGSNITINGVTGINYTYTAVSKTLVLSQNGGGNLAVAEVKAITEAVALKNTAISPAQGNRTATISYVDGNNEGASAAATIMVDTIAPDAVDLDSAANVQDTSATTTNREQLAQGIAFDASIVAPTATDIKQIKVVLGGANLDTTNDKLALNVDITLTADTTGSNITINGVTGINYTYTAVSKTLVLSQNGGGNLAVAEVKAITEAVALKNTAISPAQGNRTATISYVDGNNNEGASAAATIMVDTIAPDAVDLDSAANVQDTSATTTNREQLAQGIAFDASIVAPTATDIKQIKVVLGGANLDTTNDKLALNVDITLTLTADTTGSNITINGVTGINYTYTAVSKTLVLSQNGGGNLAVAEVKAITEAVALKNTAISPAQGNRTATISYVDGNNNEGASATATIMVDTIAPDAVDLDSAANVQNTSATTINREQLAQGIAFDASIVAPTATDIKQIKVVLGGANLDTTNDKLALNVDITLTADTTGSNITINGVTGINYTYTAVSKTLVLSQNGGGNLAVAEVKAITEAVALKNTAISPAQGNRTATISYVDGNNNEGASATATIMVDTIAPDAVDLDSAANVQNTSATTINREQLAQGIAFDASIVAPIATDIKQIKVLIGGTDLDTANDMLLLGLNQDIALNKDAAGNNINVVGLTGLNYTYDLTSKVLTLSKSDDTNFSATEAQQLMHAVKLKNTSASATEGERSATFSYVDEAGNESGSAVATTTVSFSPTLVITDSSLDTISNDAITTFTFAFSDDVLNFTKDDIIITDIGANSAIPLNTTGSSDGTINILGATVTGNSIKAGTGITWGTSGVYSKDGFTGNGSMSFTVVANNKALMAGLSTDNSNNNRDTLDYAIYARDYGQVRIYENNADIGDYGSYDAGDVFTVKRIGTEITYYKNGVLIYKSLTASTATNELHFDSAFANDNTEIKDITIKTEATLGDFTRVSDSEYTLEVTPVANSEGELSVDVAADVAKNGVGQGNIKADTHEQKYDLKAPTVESVSVKGTEGDGTTDKTVGLGIGDKIVVTLDMSEVIVLTEATSGTTAYTINFDGTNKQATYDTALNTANSNKMVFSYTIVAGDTNVAGGVQLNAGTIALTGGDTLTDIAGNAAVLNTPTVKGSSRYVLIKQDGTSQQMFIGEVEVMVDGVNVALGKTVTSDAALIHYDNWTPAKIVDGKNGTSEGMATSSAQTDGWVQIDLGQDYKIDNIVVKAVGGGTSAYDRSRVGNFSIFTSSLDYSGSTLSELTANRAVYKVGTTAASAVQTLGVNVPNNDIVIDTTPLTIDLNHDSVVEYTSLSESVAYYDVDGDGKKEHTAWVASQDGLIGFDANSDGKISGREELVLSDYVKGAKTDLEGMAYFDSNQDGNFTQDDKYWADFKVWQDKDGDGISDAGELRTLDEVGISKIELTSDNNKQTLANGDVTEYGQFKIHYTDDTQGIGGDSAFAYQNADKDTVLVTTSENSVLQGNDNADTFVFNYEGVAKVLDFNVLQGDKLDFSNLFDVGDEYNLADFFSVNDDGKDVYLVVDIHGTGNFDRPELDVILSGIGTGSVEFEALQDSLIVL